MATSCMIGIAVAFGIPEFLLGTAASLFCDQIERDKNSSAAVMITIPSNHYKLANFAQKIVMNGSAENWKLVFCSFCSVFLFFFLLNLVICIFVTSVQICFAK